VAARCDLLVNSFSKARFHPVPIMEKSEIIAASAAAGGSPDRSDLSADYTAVTGGAGVFAIPGRIVVRVIGDDRVSFFHGMCSNDIKAAAPGAVVPALFLTEHAHVIADCFVWVAADSLMIDVDAALWRRAREHLEHLLVADDVEFEDRPDLAVVDVEGPRAADAIGAALGAGAAASGQWRFSVAGSIMAANLPRLGGPAFSMVGERTALDSAIERMLAAGAAFRRVGAAALDAIRIERGMALVGVDTGDRTIALEARMERAISFSKGCYLGQETIERATARGALKRRLFGLRFDAQRIPARGAVVMLAGKEVGRATSVADSPRMGGIALAILHHSAWTPGGAVTIADPAGEIAACVEELPFK
jgi:folate-binding protein YgfZ